jgi:DNA (cytosine-5)-methyltransferase 1
MLKHLDLFSGIGGFSLGLESAGLVETVAFCDFDQYCQQVLNKNFPGVPVYGDVKELNYDKLKADGIDQIDIITGGYPCQPFSVAGSKKGEQDPRHVWPEMFRLIKELRPTWVIGENVGGHIKLGLDSVLENLESEGYSARTFSISASSVGANHKRERVWIVANSRRSVGGKQSPRNSKSIGCWSFETSEWSTDTNQIARSSERAETMADTHKSRELGGESSGQLE